MNLKLRIFRNALQTVRRFCLATAHSPQASGFLSSLVSLNIFVRSWQQKAWPQKENLRVQGHSLAQTEKQRELRLLGFVGFLQQWRCLQSASNDK